jgi:hypothetical protein
MRGRALRFDRQEVAAGHPQDEVIHLVLGFGGEQRADGADPLSEAGRELGAHRPPLQDVAHLRDELTDERSAPRRPGGGTGGGCIGDRQDVQRREALKGADGRRDVEDQILVGEVPARRRVGEQEVLRHHERNELRGVVVEPHRSDLFARDIGPDRNVLAATDLADVVQQRPERNSLGIPELGRELGRDGIDRRIVEQRIDPRHRPEQMAVDGEPMVGVTLRPAAYGSPAGHEPFERPDPVQDVERRDARLAATHHREETRPEWVRPRPRRSRSVPRPPRRRGWVGSSRRRPSAPAAPQPDRPKAARMRR